jgi:hypothetical protein
MHGTNARKRPRRGLSLFAISREEQRLRVSWVLVMAAMIALSFMACTGEIKDPSVLKLDGAPLGNIASSGMYGNNPSGGGSNISGGSQPTAAANCTAAQPKAAPAPIARLTNLEYTNTLHSLLPGVALPEITLPDDIVVEGFDNNAKAQTASPALIEQYSNNAEAVATAVTANLNTVMPCQASTSAQQDSCGAQFISQFVTRAYRRPITADETARYTALFSAAKSAYDYPSAIGMVVQAALQSPSFLYRVELGGPAKNGNAPLTGYEMASRLSYFFWDDAPDQQLLAAAASGELDSADGVEAEARRLLADPQAHAAVSNLFHQWLRFDKMDRMTKSAALFPTWNEQVAQSLRNSASEFVDHVFWDLNGSLDALLTDNKAYVDANIAPMYGLTATAGNDMQLIDTDAKQRSGILTQAGLLAAFAHETTDSPVLRGVFVMDRLLCSAPPPPPANLNLSLPDANSGSAPMTTRDRFAMTHEQGDCAGCHHAIDGFGFGFEHYDAVGKWRDTDNGLPVDAKGWIDGTRDANGDFDGAVELGQRLAQSSQVSDCVASQWFRYSLGLSAVDVDTCSLAPVAKTFADSGGDLQELMIATVTSDAFRNRPEVTP